MLRFEISQGHRNIVAHKEKLVLVVLLHFRIPIPKEAKAEYATLQ